jgi:hypothetical protein
VRVPAGDHLVEFGYFPSSFAAGLALSGLGLAAVGLLLAGGGPGRRAARPIP